MTGAGAGLSTRFGAVEVEAELDVELEAGNFELRVEACNVVLVRVGLGIDAEPEVVLVPLPATELNTAVVVQLKAAEVGPEL